MLRSVVCGIGMTACVVTVGLAQNANQTPTEEEWNSAGAQAYVAKAKALAGNDPDLQFDVAFNCTPDGTHAAGGGGGGGGDGAILGNTSYPYVPFPEQTKLYPAMHLFDNFWRFGSNGVGAWLVTTPDGYILFDTLNNAKQARENIVDEMKKVGLDPMKIKYIVFGHWHGDHTGGGHYMQELTGARVIMGRDDWKLYYEMLSNPTGSGSRMDDKVPMKRDIDSEDGMKLTVGTTTVTLISMPGHTPGSTGMIFPAKYQGTDHPILVVTASAGGSNVRNREAFIGGFEHIWNWGEKENVESVLNAHNNYNINTLSRISYVSDHYPPANNPLLYGAEKTRKYIEITRACAQARMEALGW